MVFFHEKVDGEWGILEQEIDHTGRDKHVDHGESCSSWATGASTLGTRSIHVIDHQHGHHVGFQ